ncbi:hypothetical protein WJX81_002047 [Elliptochloris bilobata]|uniref:ABC transporter domain-containing protein n=1 Tax=Elliptochloris bilobata TaxID=381761 RepID=A0AAW1QY20_9CHLO
MKKQGGPRAPLEPTWSGTPLISDAMQLVPALKRSSTSVAVTIPEDAASDVQAFPTALEPVVTKLLERTAGSIGSQDVADLGVKAAHMRGGMNIVFKDISCLVRNSAKRGEKLYLLRDVSGCVMAGEMTALMGPSGSGKTTLLDVLAGRKTEGHLSGQVLVANRRPTQMFMRRHCAYVEQFDTLIDNLTVQEMLLYTAELKMKATVPLELKLRRVDALVQQLALDICRHVRIGDAMKRGISGGQAKRTNIGVALISAPRILFLDEPTSGLDSYTSLEVMQHVAALTAPADAGGGVHSGGMTICATIHSPTSATFGLFGRVIILLRGQMVFFGENGTHAARYFAKHFPDLPTFQNSASINRAEWLVTVTTKADRDGRADEFASTYTSSELCRTNSLLLLGAASAAAASRGGIGRFRAPGTAEAPASGQEQLTQEDASELATRNETTTSFWWGYKTLIKYRLVTTLLDTRFVVSRTADKLLNSLIQVTLYWGVGASLRADNLTNIIALVYMWAVFPGLVTITYMPAILGERRLFIRERSDGHYRAITYLCAKLTMELLLAVPFSVVSAALVFYLTRMSGSFAFFWVAYLTTIYVGIALGFFIAAFSPSMDLASVIVSSLVSCLCYSTGNLIRVADMPPYWRWFPNINFLYYAWAALMKNEFEECTTVFVNGHTVLEFYGFVGGVTKWHYLAIEASFFIVFFVGCYLSMRFIQHQRR